MEFEPEALADPVWNAERLYWVVSASASGSDKLQIANCKLDISKCILI